MTNIAIIATIIVALITSVLGPVVVTWFKEYLEKVRTQGKPSTVKEAIDFNETIDEQLSLMCATIKSDRIWIGQFHNGGYFYPTGKSIQKFSIFYEKFGDKNIPPPQILQQVPVSLFPKTIAKLYKDREIHFSSYKINNPSHDLYIFESEYSSKSFYLLALEDINGHFIGIMGISFNDINHKLSDEEWTFIRQKINIIGTLLTNYLKK